MDLGSIGQLVAIVGSAVAVVGAIVKIGFKNLIGGLLVIFVLAAIISSCLHLGSPNTSAKEPDPTATLPKLKSAEEYKDRADNFARNNLFAEAIADYTKALRASTTRDFDSQLLRLRARTYQRQQKHEEAIADLSKAIELCQEVGSASTMIGLLDERAQSFEAAGQKPSATADRTERERIMETTYHPPSNWEPKDYLRWQYSISQGGWQLVWKSRQHRFFALQVDDYIIEPDDERWVGTFPNDATVSVSLIPAKDFRKPGVQKTNVVASTSKTYKAPAIGSP